MTGGISSRTCYTKLNFDFSYVRFLSLRRDPYYISLYTIYLHLNFNRLNLELYTAGSVMTPAPVVVKVNECISRLAYILLSTSHGGFPVVVEKNDKQVFYGFINRYGIV